MKFGWLLRQTRKGVGLTQEAMAEEIHIARSTISKLERDEMTLTAEDLVRWLQVVKSKLPHASTPVEAGLAFCQGVDLVLLTEMLTRLVGGVTYWLSKGGWIT